jgi:RNA polymerase sigma-70 factor, ECF subfamily
MPQREEPQKLAELFALELEARSGRSVHAAELGPALAEAWSRATAAWPALRIGADVFVAHIAAHLPPDVEPSVALTALAAEDLYLALACARGEPDALRLFEAQFRGDLEAAAARLRAGPALDDLRQAVWQKLFVAEPGCRPRIWEYSGHGPLRAWYRVIVVRAALDARRREARADRASDEQALFGVASPERDPELEYLRRLYAHEFKLAFEEAIRSLSAEHRNTLRAHYAHDLTIDQIGSMLGVHRATAARRVSKAREALLSETRRRLMQRLTLSRSELESVIRMIQSQLHLSVHRLLS